MAYELGRQFKISKSNSTSNEESIIQGKSYRITILSERLIRFEYNKNGFFEDRPSQLALFRNFEKPKFSIKQDERFLEVTTDYFKLEYKKESPFYSSKVLAGNNLRVNLLGTDRDWFFGHVEAKNYKSTNVSLDFTKEKSKLRNGLYSLDGFASIDDSTSLVLDEGGMFVKRENEVIDTYLFMYKDDFFLALKDYFKLTGKPPMIPRYALGNWWSKNEDYDLKEIEKVVNGFKNNDIPISTFVLNKNWHENEYEGKTYDSGFTFNKEKFKDPKVLIDYLHDNNIYLGLQNDPLKGIRPYETYYEKALEYLKEDKDKIPFNAFDPKFLDVYFKMFVHPAESFGSDFWWINSFDKNNLDNLFMLNHYHFWDMNRMVNKRALLLSRNSMVAPHRYPVHYSGKIKVSWDTLNKLPYYNANASNLGVVWWSHDIGGTYGGIEDNELYARFIELGCFSPIFRLNSEKGKYYKREPWKWSIRTLEIAKKYMKLRHKLIPYIYSEAYNYYNEGIPIFQPLYYYNPEMYDDDLYKKEYYFGSSMLVSPITEKKNHLMNRTVHKFFLPKGMWYDFITGKKFPGNRNYVTFFKEEDYPVFVRAGAIIPMSLDEDINSTKTPTNMEFQIFPGISRNYNLYEDDGRTNNYKRGEFLLTNIEYNYMENNYTVIVRPVKGKKEIVPESRNYTFRFRNTKKALDVSAHVNGEQTPVKTEVLKNDFLVTVKNVSTLKQLTINCKGEDIEIEALRLVNEDIDEIISDIAIETELKEKIANILFAKKAISKKRIAIKKLRRQGLERKFIRIFLNLLEYVEQV